MAQGIRLIHAQMFIENSPIKRSVIRRRIISEELIPYVCAICGQKPEWQGKILTLILDHINGVNDDNRLSNLRFVCPNCDMQLDTYGAKNARRGKFAKERL